MRKHSLVASIATLAMVLTPLSAFAATAKTEAAVSEDEVLQILDTQEADASLMMDRGGGGTSGLYYPGPYGGITVDASVTKEVTPDFVAVNGYCEVSNMDTREEVRAELTRIYNAIKTAVGADGRVRRSGTPSVYPYYDPYGGAATSKQSGSVNIYIRLTRPAAAQRIADLLDSYNCSPGWDVRLVDTEDYEMAILDDLLVRVNKRKKVFEKLLGKKLTKVTGASLSTWVDGYSSYDPETNKADATTTLSITFDTGGRTRLPVPTPMMETKAMPKG